MHRTILTKKTRVYAVLNKTILCLIPFILIRVAYSSPTLANLKALEQQIKQQQDELAKNQQQLMKLKVNYQKTTVLANASPTPWKGTSIGAGATLNTGDNPSQKGNTTLNLKYSTPPWIFTTKLDQQYEHSADKGLSTDKYTLSSQVNYLFGDSSYLYTGLIYTYDRFSGNDYLWNYSLGYGHTVYHSKNVIIDTQIGPGYQQRKLQGAAEPEGTLSLNTQAELNWQINDKTAFTETITPVYSADLTTINTITALTTQLKENLGIQAQFDTKYLSNTPDGSKRFTTTTVLNVLYTFA